MQRQNCKSFIAFMLQYILQRLLMLQFILQRHPICFWAYNFYHCVIYHTGMHSILLCLYLAFFTYPLFIDLLRLGSHNMTFKEDKQGRKELQPNFYIFLKQIFFNSSYCCIHFPCRQVHRPFISVNFDSLNRGIHFFSVDPLLQDIHSVGVCIDNACVWWTLTPFFFSVCLSPLYKSFISACS